jgi:gas vesicle protein
MRKLLSLFAGFTIGASIGAALVALFSPISGSQLAANLRRGYQETMTAARQASALRRAELEAELKQMQQRRRS